MLNPNAKMTLTTAACNKCGQPIGGYYVVMLCDDCLEEAIPEKPCHDCGKVAKHHPRMTRHYDGGWKNEDGSFKPARYFCADCARRSDLRARGVAEGQGLEP